MLPLVIASSILALILLAAATVELVCRWAIEAVGKRAASRPEPSQHQTDNRLGLLGEPNQFQAR
jgi:hypothetical protein